MVKALDAHHDVQLWRNDVRFPRVIRQAAVVGRAWTSVKPDFVFYGHVFLSAVHAVTPRLRNIPYGVFLHGQEVWGPLRERHRKAMEGAAVLVANSQFTVERARAANPWLPEVRIAWLGVAADVPLVPDAGKLGPVALMVGRVVSSERGKGHDEVLNAWPSVRAAVPNARLVIVGEGDDRGRLEARVAAEDIAGVEFRGFVTDEERDRLYGQTRAFLFPSRQEGFGLVAAEAAAHGVACLTLRNSVFDELFPEGSGAVFANSTSPGDLAAPIIRLLSDDAFAREAGVAARRRVETCFTEEQFMTRFRGALRPLVP